MLYDPTQRQCRIRMLKSGGMALNDDLQNGLIDPAEIRNFRFATEFQAQAIKARLQTEVTKSDAAEVAARDPEEVENARIEKETFDAAVAALAAKPLTPKGT